MAALMAGQLPAQVAREYKLDPSLVWRWSKQMPATQLQEIAKQKTDEFAELLTNAIREIFKTLAFSVQFIRTAEGLAWLKQFSPAEAATFIGVTTDKGVRLLEAAGRAAERAERPMETPTQPGDDVPERIQ